MHCVSYETAITLETNLIIIPIENAAVYVRTALDIGFWFRKGATVEIVRHGQQSWQRGRDRVHGPASIEITLKITFSTL